MPSNRWKKGTKRYFIAEFALQNASADSTYHALSQKVRDQIRPWIFSANIGGARQPKPLRLQLIELRHEINRVYAILGREGMEDIPPEEIQVPDWEEEMESAVKKAEEVSENLPEADPDERRFFLKEIRRIRKWIEERASMGDIVDEISMRPVVAAKTALAAGIPAKALLHMMTLHWNSETRTAAGIETFDFMSFSRQVLKDRKLDPKQFHKLLGLALVLAEARVPIMAVGPSGTGKSHLAKQVASLLGLSYGECPMTAGATPSWLLGSNTIDGFVSRPFLEAYSGGGVFNFEELDASDPNMLLVANNALASDKLFNPANGEVYERHPDFIPFSTANTFGLGANRQFVARERLDAATIDRWRMGRVYIPIDEEIEEAILFS